MDSATDNELTPGVDSETGDATAALPLKQRLRSLLRRVQKRHLVIIASVAVLLMMLVVWGVISLTAGGDVAAIDPANLPSTQPERITFHAALAELVQAGDESIHLYDFSPTSDELETLACVERLRVLRVDNGSLTPQAGAVLASMPHLEQLHFRDVSMDDATLDAIAQSQTIWLLNISGAKLSPEAIARLADMPRLHQLRLAIENAGNRYTQSIARIKKLRALHLIGFGVNNQSLKSLVELPNLESLYIDDSNVNDEGWKWLFENKPHLHVHIDQKHHDRDPHKH